MLPGSFAAAAGSADGPHAEEPLEAPASHSADHSRVDGAALDNLEVCVFQIVLPRLARIKVEA